jgi:hypothetical protein
MGKCVNTQQDAFTEPTPQRLEGLGAGCYVQIHLGEQCEWVEITDAEGDECVGTSHPALSASNTNGQTTQAASEALRFRKDQIIALGCDRYCFC